MELLNTLFNAISLYRYIFWPLFGLMMLVIIFIRWWDQVSYFFLNFWASFPALGFISRLSKSHEPRRLGTGRISWHPSEEALCGKYYQYYRSTNRDANFYHRCVNYLNKVGERGRKPTGIILWLCSIVLVILEAFIFALVLSPFIANNITANQAELSAIIISILIGVILVPATHLMGAQLHKNSLFSKIRYWYKEAFREGNARGLESNSAVTLENTNVDDSDPAYLQMLNRVNHSLGARREYVITLITLVLISTFAIGAYFIRSATINALDTQQINGSPFSQNGDANNSPFEQSETSNQSPFQLPNEAAKDNQQADKRATTEITNNKVFASKLTFAILSVIFIGVQLIGILIGYFRSFAGIESKSAAKYIGNFSSSEEFSAWYARQRERVERDAQNKLVALQSKMALGRTSSGNSMNTDVRTFADYINGKLRDQHSHQAEQKLAQQASTSHFDLPETFSSTPPVAKNTGTSAVTQQNNSSKTDIDQQQSSAIKELGDISQCDDAELQLLAEHINVSLDLLIKQRNVQKILNRRNGQGVV